jgi:hypothetical protein
MLDVLGKHLLDKGFQNHILPDMQGHNYKALKIAPVRLLVSLQIQMAAGVYFSERELLCL